MTFDLRQLTTYIAIALALLFLGWPTRALPESLVASFYWQGDFVACQYRGQDVAFNPEMLIAAHPTWPCGTLVEVCLKTCIAVSIQDRGPYTTKVVCCGRPAELDLSLGAARALNMLDIGVALVRVQKATE